MGFQFAPKHTWWSKTFGTRGNPGAGNNPEDETRFFGRYGPVANALAPIFMTEEQKRAAAEAAAKLNEAAAGPKPPPAPDITDELVAKARRRQAYRLMSSQGQASTFLTGPFGSFSSTRAGY